MSGRWVGTGVGNWQVLYLQCREPKTGQQKIQLYYEDDQLCCKLTRVAELAPILAAPAPGLPILVAGAPDLPLLTAPAPGLPLLTAPAPGLPLLAATAPGLPILAAVAPAAAPVTNLKIK